MADILIRGMEMPTYTTKAYFGIDADDNPLCMVYNYDETEPDIYDVVSLSAKHKWPIIHGEWVEPDDDYGYLVCSACEERSPNDERWNFCPSCGADMREVDEYD